MVEIITARVEALSRLDEPFVWFFARTVRLGTITNLPGLRSIDRYGFSTTMEEMRILSVKIVRRSGTIITRSASNVRAAGQPLGASMLSPNNSIENQLTLSSLKRLS